MATRGEGTLARLPLRVSRLIGKQFRNEEHEQLGEIRDLVADPSGKIGYLLVAYGGTLGIGERLVPVPWDSARISHSGENYVVSINISKENFEKAPYLSEREWSNYAATDWEGNIQQYYESVPRPGEIH